jgi:hypothetical protein
MNRGALAKLSVRCSDKEYLELGVRKLLDPRSARRLSGGHRAHIDRRAALARFMQRTAVLPEQEIDKLARFMQRTAVLPATLPVAAADAASEASSAKAKAKLAGFKQRTQRTAVLPATLPVAAADAASEAKALIGAPRVRLRRPCIGGGAQRCCLWRCAYAESVKAHEKESHGRNDSDKAVMEVRT